MDQSDEFMAYLEGLRSTLEATGRDDPRILVVTCIDLRYPGLIHSHLETAAGGYFRKRYDQVSLAGAGLAGVIDFPPDPKPAWAATFLDHIGVCKMLHDIMAVIVLEHRSCGAYRVFGLLGNHYTEEEERRVHEEQVGRLKAVIGEAHPDLLVDSFLLPVIPYAVEGPATGGPH